MNGERKKPRVKRFSDEGKERKRKKRVIEVLNKKEDDASANENAKVFKVFKKVLYVITACTED